MSENNGPKDVQTTFRWSPPHSSLKHGKHIDFELCTPRPGRRDKVNTISHIPVKD